MQLRPHLRTITAALATAWLVVIELWIHLWYTRPFATWVGWDEAYIAAFAERMIERTWTPYVDAVSHRGPLLYWIAAGVELIGGRNAWAPFRYAALLFTVASVVLLFALGAVSRRPLAGFIAATAFVFATLFGMEPKDGIGFNGELVALPFVLAATLCTVVAHERTSLRLESRIWLAAACGALLVLAGLCKQIAFAHLLPLALWWLAITLRDRTPIPRLSLRPMIGLLIGVLTPLAAVFTFFARGDNLRPFLYYFFTYNRTVYLGPITLGFAVESSFLFLRDNVPMLFLTALGLAAAWTRVASRTRNASSFLTAFSNDALLASSALQLLLGLIGAMSTFRFWGHYFITAVPWIGVLAGLLLEERFNAPNPDGTRMRPRFSYALVIVPLIALSIGLGQLTRLWLDGQRRRGFFGNPGEDPVTSYIVANSAPGDSLFVWGFAPEYYVSTKRRAASRYVFTTFVAGVVPWFYNLTPEQEARLVVPGSREQLLRELREERPAIILDVPLSVTGRSLRAYPELVDFLDDGYCYERTIAGGNDRLVHAYLRKKSDGPCEKAPPP